MYVRTEYNVDGGLGRCYARKNARGIPRFADSVRNDGSPMRINLAEMGRSMLRPYREIYTHKGVREG